MVGFWYSAVHVKSEQSHRVKGVVGIARPVGASQACTRQPGSGSVTAVRHPSAVTARNEEVFYGDPSGSATRCNVQCERDGAVGSAGCNRGSDCALGSATQGVGATLGRNFPGNPKFWDSGLSSTRRPPTTHENDIHRAIQVKRPLSFSIGQVEKRNCAAG